LAKGADVNAKVNDGWTALMWARRSNHSKIVDLLKQAGAKEEITKGDPKIFVVDDRIVDAKIPD
jgi:ankyrin repeat protein